MPAKSWLKARRNEAICVYVLSVFTILSAWCLVLPVALFRNEWMAIWLAILIVLIAMLMLSGKEMFQDEDDGA